MSASLVEHLRRSTEMANKPMSPVPAGERSSLAQHNYNERLRNDAFSAEEHLLQQSKFAFYQRPWSELQTLIHRSNHALKALEQNTDYTNLLEFDQEKCLQDCEQRVARHELVSSKDQPSAADFQMAIHKFSQLRSLCEGKAFFGDALERAMKQTTKAEQSIMMSTLNSADFVAPILEVHDLMKELVTLPGLPDDKKLVELEETIRRLAFDTEEAKRQQQQLLGDGDIQEGEEKYYETLQLQEATTANVRKKFEVIDEHVETVVDQAVNNIKTVQQRCNKMCDDLVHEGGSLKHRCAADIRSISNFINRVNAEHDDYIQRYQREMERSNAFLKDTNKKQEAIWNKITALERELTKLSKDRYEEIQTRVTNFESAEKHKVSYSNFIDFTKRHKEALQLTIKNLEVHEYLAQFIRNFANDHCDTLLMSLNTRKNDVEEERLHSHEQHLQHFRDLYLTVGELSYKKTCTRDELDEQIKTTEAQLEICMDSWNPDAKIYSQKKKELLKLREELDTQLSTLDTTQHKYLEWFKPTENYLRIMDKPFSHPKDELKNINDTRRGKIAEYKALMAAPPSEEDYEITQQLRLQHQPTHTALGIGDGNTLSEDFSTTATATLNSSPTSLVIGGIPLKPAPPPTSDAKAHHARRALASSPPLTSQVFSYTNTSHTTSTQLPSL